MQFSERLRADYSRRISEVIVDYFKQMQQRKICAQTLTSCEFHTPLGCVGCNCNSPLLLLETANHMDVVNVYIAGAIYRPCLLACEISLKSCILNGHGYKPPALPERHLTRLE